jgi:hypothetical protein
MLRKFHNLLISEPHSILSNHNDTGNTLLNKVSTQVNRKP